MSSIDISRLTDKQIAQNSRSSDIAAFHRFMLWAYEESDTNFEDEFLKAAIHTIIYYLTKHYNAGSERTH